MSYLKRTLLESRKGTSTVVFAMALVVLTTSAAFAVDIGNTLAQKARLSTAVDSAALAGAQELAANTGYAESFVETYLQKNTTNTDEIEVLIGDDQRTIEVTAAKTVNNYFARVIGRDQEQVSASATAKVENISSLNGARPLAIVQQDFVYGARYTLKEGGGDGTTGNYAAIALGGTGGSTYRYNLLNGFGGTISVGDLIQTETGNIAGATETSITHLVNGCTHSPSCTYQYYNRNCSRIIFLPVVNTLMVNGRKHVQVLGFATFFLEGVTNHGGQADVVGRFITYNMEGETASNINDYGTYGIRLIK